MTKSIDGWWKKRGAPPPGTPLGALDAIAEGEAREFRFSEGRGVFSMLVIRRNGHPHAYVNACPHVWLPLNFRSARIVSGDGERLVCSNHSAEFSVADGSCLSGPAEPGCSLIPIPLRVDEAGRLIIGGIEG